MKIEDLTPASYNPRKISKKAAEGLQASLQRYGDIGGIVYNKKTGNLVSGHQRVAQIRAAGGQMVGEDLVVKGETGDDLRFRVRVVDWTEAQEKAANLTANNPHIGGEWDDGLDELLAETRAAIGDPDFLALRLDELETLKPKEVEEDEVPELPSEAVTKLGDIWQLGDHVVVCGDCRSVALDASGVQLCHADPPYGMNKDIENDNLHAEKLDAFQLEWFRHVRQFLADNGSVYIWGNAEDLWRLWWGGLRDVERMTFRNEIVWDKGLAQQFAFAKHSGEALRCYNIVTERCLFFMLGEQGFNNNADNYFEGWEPIRYYLLSQRKLMGWDVPTMKRVAGHSDLYRDHWTSKSQWSFPTRDVYEAFQREAKGDAFKREYDDLKREYDDLKREFHATRAYFDNTHDNMTDVWRYDRVKGEERCGHPTPKPVAMVGRIIKSSCPDGGQVIDPFLGSGTTLVAAEQLGRKCYGIELEPRYVDVTIERWEQLTGGKAARKEGG